MNAIIKTVGYGLEAVSTTAGVAVGVIAPLYCFFTGAGIGLKFFDKNKSDKTDKN